MRDFCRPCGGYSRLIGAHEKATLDCLKAHHRELVGPKIEEHRGRIFNTTGDGVLAQFPSVVDAVRCAVEIQRGYEDRTGGVRTAQGASILDARGFRIRTPQGATVAQIFTRFDAFSHADPGKRHNAITRGTAVRTIDCMALRSPINQSTLKWRYEMSQVHHSEQKPMESFGEVATAPEFAVQHSEQHPMASLEAAERHALRLQDPEKLIKACAIAQELVPEGTVVANCGAVSLTLFPTGHGFGRITVGINSFLGPISAVSFFGEWLRLGFPPAAGVFNNGNSKIFNLNTSQVVIVSGFIPGRYKVFANLTYLLATTARGPCIGLLPSDTKQF